MRKSLRKSPRQQCEIGFETWGPHPGCAEYMTKPEIHRCLSPSTHVVRSTDEYASWYGNRGVEVSRVCASHSRDRDALRGYDPAVTIKSVYRYRTV